MNIRPHLKSKLTRNLLRLTSFSKVTIKKSFYFPYLQVIQDLGIV